MLTAAKKRMHTEMTRAVDALEQTRKDRERVDELIALRDELVQRMHDVCQATARP